MSNYPDDWNSYWTRCTHCGKKYHLSEYGCDCLEAGTCANCGADCGASAWTGEEHVCEDCTTCCFCGEYTTRESAVEDAGDWFCGECVDKGHGPERINIEDVP